MPRDTMKMPLKSLADLPRAAFQPPPPQWVEWEPDTARNLKKEMLNQATTTLRTWLDARIADLIRERVPRGSITVHQHGNRTVIRVAGVDRFEFKLKIFMEKS